VQALDEPVGVAAEQALERDDLVGQRVHRHAEEAPRRERGRRTSMPCWKAACSVSTGASCRPATKDVRRFAGVAAPGSLTAVAGPKLRISVMDRG